MTKALICYMLSIVCLIIATMIAAYLIFDFHNIYWWGIGLLLALIFLSIAGIGIFIAWGTEFYGRIQ